MNQHELEPQSEETVEADIEGDNWRKEMNVIQLDIEQGNTLTVELYTRFQELGGQLADRETDVVEGQKARLLLAIDCAELQFKGGFIQEAIESLRELADEAYQAGEAYDQIVEIADDRRMQYEAALTKQPKP